MPGLFNRDVLKRFLAIQCPLAIVIALIILGIYQFEKGIHIAGLMTSERTIQRMQKDEVARTFHLIGSELKAEAARNELREFLDTGDMKYLMELSSEWRTLVETSGRYYSIRYIDERGMETLRVNMSDGVAYVVPQEKLQDKAQRYYFNDTVGLSGGEIYVSPLDLAMERGAIDTPEKPVIRFATPVFDLKGAKRGLVAMNHIGDKLIGRFRSKHADLQGVPILLDRDGNWIIGPDPEKDWCFMYEGHASGGSFADEFPELWARIFTSDEGQFLDKRGLFTFSTIHPLAVGWVGRAVHKPGDVQSLKLKNSRGYYWKSLSHVPVASIKAVSASLLIDLMVLYTLLFIILSAISLWLARLWSEKASAAIRLSEAKEEWDRTFDSIADPIMILGTDMRIAKCNLALAGLLGMSPRKIVGQSCEELICDPSESHEGCPCLNAKAEGKPQSVEAYKPALGGYYHIAVSPIFGMGGELTGYVHYMRDITGRKQMEQELAYSEGFLKSIIENEPECVKLIDEECRLISMNPAGLAMIEVEDVAPLVGRSMLPMVMPEYREAFAEFTRGVCRGKSGTITFEAQGMKGARLWLESHAVPFHDIKNGRTVLLGVTRDITERKRAEDALRQALADKNVLIKEVHHRVKNNLMIIQSLLKLQQSEVKDEGSRRKFEESSNRVRSMGMIHEMLYKSDDLKSIDFSEYAGGLVGSLVRGSAYGDVRVRLELDVEHIPMDVDKVIPCGLILNELVTNALKYAFKASDGGDTLSVRCSKGDDGLITLVARDNGPGLPEGFDMNNSDSLGMRLVSALAAQIEAEVEISSEGGASFTLRFKDKEP